MGLAVDDERCTVIQGSIVGVEPDGSRRRVLKVQTLCNKDKGGTSAPEATITVLLQADRFPGTEVWMSCKGSRKLLCSGVQVRIEAICQEERISSVVSDSVWHAVDIRITRVLPSAQYLAQLLSFPAETIHCLFPIFSTTRNIQNSGKVFEKEYLKDFASALEPCTSQDIESLLQLCRSETLAGRAVKLFKHPLIIQCANSLLQHHRQCDGVPGRRPAPPRTSQMMWEALLRMERRWCREPCDGPRDQYQFDLESYSYKSQTGVSKCVSRDWQFPQLVDPAENLPNPSDVRRQKYIDERKRPQVEAMMEKIVSLLEAVPDDKTLELVEIGGGRGYLALAIAAYFAQRKEIAPSSPAIHITVVDNNESSLQAGRKIAETACLVGSNQMSFELCDLGDSAQRRNLLASAWGRGANRDKQSSRRPFDLVFGLHCCGGLAEAAIELAIASQASFCVSACCFRSNSSLASLSMLADTMIPEPNIPSNASTTSSTDPKPSLQQGHCDDRSSLSSLAVLVGSKGQHRAIRAYNAMRLVAAEHRFKQCLSDTDSWSRANTSATRGRPRLVTWQETFPVEYSAQNRVLMGKFEEPNV